MTNTTRLDPYADYRKFRAGIPNPANEAFLSAPNIVQDSKVYDGIVYNSALKSYIKYVDGKETATLDAPLIVNGRELGFTTSELSAIVMHINQVVEASKQYTVYRHNKTGGLYVTLALGDMFDADSGEPVVTYMSLEVYRVWTHTRHNFFTKKNEDGKQRFEATGDVWVNGNIMKKPEYVGK